MYTLTSNAYSFKYLITGISGPGIEKVYLPPVPPEEDILFKKEQKFVRPEMPEHLKKAVKEMLAMRNERIARNGELAHPDWVHPNLQEEINIWEQTEWERSDDGIWFWNNGVPTYMTGFYYWYLSGWRTYFGIPDYRETDKEITYWLKFIEEDPDCYGGAFNTIRRYGKSVLMGAWATYRATRNFNHFCGMQGETDDKIKKFYNKFIRKPFYKLPYYHQPTYNTATQQTNQIEFDIPPKRNKKNTIIDEVDSLESVIEYRASGEGEYDGDPLNTYLMEEPGKCLAKGTKVRMFDGSVCKVEEIRIGDLLMGDDSMPRKVLNTGRGVSGIYKITPNSKGEPWYCNEHHILSCKISGGGYFKGYRKGDVVNITIKTFLALSPRKKQHLMCYRVGVEYQEKRHSINPYLLGLWLGDGSSASSVITNIDKEVIAWIKSQYSITILDRSKTGKATYIYIKGYLRKYLRELNLYKNKHIPQSYIIDSRENRLQLLAGLIDTDGHRCVKKDREQRNYEITQKRKVLAEQIREVALSCGFYASINEKIAKMKRKDGSVYTCPVYRVSIFGHNLYEIPCLVERKKMPIPTSLPNGKNPMVHGFSVSYDRIDEYYGFNIDGNHLFLLEDYTVTHNTKKVSIYNDGGEGRWDVVLPCLNDGLEIIGKALLGTTVENLNMHDKGGQAYKNLFYDSDYDQKQEDGRTKSGLYAAFLPGDCALKGYWDKWGHPMREEAKTALLRRRQSFKKNANRLAGHIRKYPLSVKEIFYINPTGCEFNAAVLQDRRDEIDMAPASLVERFDLVWERNERFSRVVLRPNPVNGWFKASWVPRDPSKECNLVQEKFSSGLRLFAPKNDNRFAIGMDPIDHGVVVEGRAINSTDEIQGGRRSKPVLLIKTKYDSALDGVLSQEELELRAQPGKMVDGKWMLDDEGRKYDYQSNRYFGMMDSRPFDPNVLYERTLMVCWYFGCSLHVENQKPGVIRYFYEHGCGDFILNKYVPVEAFRSRTMMDDGTAASTTIIQEYTGALSTYIEYFGHTVPFRELIEDWLLFNPRKTTEFDYSVASGFCELACKIKPKLQPKSFLDITTIMPVYDRAGWIIN